MSRASFVALVAFIACAVLHDGGAWAQSPAAAPSPPSPSLPSAPASSGIDCTTVLFNLTTCLTYVEAGSTVSTPDKECCPALAGVMESQPICLCELLSGGAENFGMKIDGSKALKLPSICKVETPPPSTCAEFGYNISNVAGFALAPVPSSDGWPITVVAIPTPPSSSPTSHEILVASSSSNHKILVVGLSVAAAVLALAVIFLLLLRTRRNKSLKDEHDEEGPHGMMMKPDIFSYAEMKAATEDFNPSNIIGEGGYGLVFKVRKLL